MWRYLKSREFWLIIFGLIALGVLVYVIFFFVFLPGYTNHGETVIVPEVTEKSLESAVTELEDLGLRYEVVDSHYKSNLPPMTVLSQDPLGVSKVKPGRRIYLTINKVLPPMVTVPDVFGVSQYQAKLRLEGANLIIEKMEYVPHEYKNLVLAAFYKGKRIEEGDTLPKYSKIVLRVGRGKGDQRVDIPKLVGQPYQTAIGMLHRNGLNVGVVRFLPNDPAEKWTIVRQNPTYAPGDSINLGSEVDLFIAGEEPDEGIEEMIFGLPDEASEAPAEEDEDNPLRSVPRDSGKSKPKPPVSVGTSRQD
jgi:beta-lactam-binding protein with PASTA domain